MIMKKFYMLLLSAMIVGVSQLQAQTGKNYDVKKVPAGASIRIDGNFTDWEDLTGFQEDQINEFYHQRLNNTALVAPDDQLDHEATWRLAYDNSRLYGYFMVNDDLVQDPDSLTSWYHDKLEMYFKVGDDAVIPEGKGDIGGICDQGYFQYVFDINNTNPDFTQGSLPGNDVCVSYMEGNWEHEVVLTDNGYAVEWSIRFDGLVDINGTTFDPAGNVQLYMAPHVHDNDNTDMGEVNPRGRSYWSVANQGGDATEGGHAFERNFWELGTPAAEGAPGESGAPGTLTFLDENLVFDLPPLPDFPANAAQEYTLTKLSEEQSITIDGTSDDWDDVITATDDQVNTYYHQRVDNTALIAPSDQLDHQATWKLVYDDNGIYGYFTVQDDVVQEPGAETSWYHDKLEMYFQVGNAGMPSTKGDVGGLCNLGFYQYVFDINNPGYVQGDLPGNTVCVPLQEGNWEHAVTVTDLGYEVEWFIAFEGLKDAAGITFDPSGSTTLKFAPHVHDNDNTDLGEVNPRARGYWSMQNQGGDATEGGHAFERNFWEAGTEARNGAPGEAGAPGILRFGSVANVTSVSNPSISDVSIYPNPADNMIKVSGDVDRVELVNAVGAIVLEQAGNLQRLDVSAIDQGVYFIKLYDNGNYKGASRVIIK